MRKFTSKVCLFLFAILLPVAGYAVGLGRLTVSSAQGHPFKAEIELVAVKKEDKSSLVARLASQETFRQANIDYSSVLSTFKTSIETHSDGQPYVRIISPQPIAEPFLNMLVELNSSSGRLLREYTVLPSLSENDAHVPTELIPGKSDVSVKQDEKLPIQNESDSVNKAHTAYGPVKQGDTLARIAKNIVLPAGASFNQMLVALQRANRDAFFGNNMNQLKTGPILRIPHNSEVAAIAPTEADQEVKAQTADWYRRRLADIEGAVEGELKLSVIGGIESAVEVNITQAQALPYEVLKLSKGEESGNESTYISNNMGGEVGGREAGAQHGFHAMGEDAIEKPRQLDEVSERVKKNVGEQQRVLESGNSALANIQQQVEAFEHVELDAPILAPSPVAAAKAKPFTGEVNNSSELMAAPAAIAPSEMDELGGRARKSLQVHIASLPSHASVRESSAHMKNSIADDLAANIEYVVGAVVLLITGIVGVSMVRGRKG